MIWIRKIGSTGAAFSVILPPKLLGALGWHRGDHLEIKVIGDNAITMQRVQEQKLTDEVINAARPESTIHHD